MLLSKWKPFKCFLRDLRKGLRVLSKRRRAVGARLQLEPNWIPMIYPSESNSYGWRASCDQLGSDVDSVLAVHWPRHGVAESSLVPRQGFVNGVTSTPMWVLGSS